MEAFQASKKYEILKKGRPLGMSRLKWFNLKGQFQNRIGYSYPDDYV
jgi:hypothetical protein